MKILVFITTDLNNPHKLNVSVTYFFVWKARWTLMSVFYRCCHESALFCFVAVQELMTLRLEDLKETIEKLVTEGA